MGLGGGTGYRSTSQKQDHLTFPADGALLPSLRWQTLFRSALEHSFEIRGVMAKLQDGNLQHSKLQHDHGTGKTDSAGRPVALSGDDSLEKIREILLGPLAQDHERRLRRLDQELRDELLELRETFQREIQALRDLVVARTGELTQVTRRESITRTRAQEELRDEIRAISGELGTLIERLESRLHDEFHRLREQLQGRSRRLQGELENRIEELGHSTESRLDELRRHTVDCRDLAFMLNRLSRQIDGGRARHE